MKRQREGEGERRAKGNPAKKQRKGFSVGPENLPEGQHKRKVKQIKEGLIQYAKIRKNYEKVKRQQRNDDDDHDDLPPTKPQQDSKSANDPPILDRGFHVEAHEEPAGRDELPDLALQKHDTSNQRSRRTKLMPYAKEAEAADKRREEFEARRLSKIEADRQRQEKIEERDKFRRAMAKARSGGVNGQRKLGRESKVLLERVQKMMGQ